MLRYRLDDLGAYQFEKLVQSFLKAYAGLAVESWGNRGDWGRDAYAAGSLRFPDKRTVSPGSFVFQVKFVEGANSAGARPASLLLASSSKEIANIRRRIQQRTWVHPRNFTFITNSNLEAGTREQIRTVFAQAFSNTTIIVWGGDDVCDVLDQYTTIVRAFPQLLSIRDLEELISSALSRESRERSESALQVALELVSLFAPTTSYERTWSVLRKHHFAVLEGPPEVGKSAIAWMIGLTKAGEGWETIECRSPDTFFQVVDRARSQVFIADDAFGRTEYDPTRTSRWEADLDRILHRVDAKHWLIWTSRKHILQRACDRMDAQGKARSFPSPASVLVDVKTLTIEERALILFRHARAARLPQEAKDVIRDHARMIVSDDEFTPERIRRFIQEGLPNLLRGSTTRRTDKHHLKAAIKEALRNPTKQMRLAFRALPLAYKWFLIALLEISEVDLPLILHVKGNLEKLQELYEVYCPAIDQEPFTTVMDHLTEAFIRTRRTQWSGASVDWIHPSYRDLVIEELAKDGGLRDTFLKRASLEGVKLAVSSTGGQEGRRRMPLISSAESWEVVCNRCLALITSGDVDRDLLELFADAASEGVPPTQQHALKSAIGRICHSIQQKWDRGCRLITASELEAFSKAREHASPIVPCPDLSLSWDSLDAKFWDRMKAAKHGFPFDFIVFDALAAFAQAVKSCCPDFLTEKRFPTAYESEIAKVVEEAELELGSDPLTDDPDELRALADQVGSMASAVRRLTDFAVRGGRRALDLAEQLKARSTHLEELAAEKEPGEYEPDHEDSTSGSDMMAFDVDALFSEL